MSTLKQKLIDFSKGALIAGALFPLTFSHPNPLEIQTSKNYEKRTEINAICSKTYNSKNSSKANKSLLDFPNKIPGAKSIEKFIVPHAKHYLVHIKQKHLTLPHMSVERATEVKKNQEGIYKILSYLLDKNKLKSAYTEGYTSSDAKALNQINSRIDDARKNPERYTFLKMPENTKRYLEVLSKYNAVDKINNDRFLKILPGEISGEQNYNAQLMKISNREKYQKMQEQREDFILKQIADSKNIEGIAIYGSSHCWGGTTSFEEFYNESKRNLNTRDNIYEWNRDNPNNKFSLIEITPKE